MQASNRQAFLELFGGGRPDRICWVCDLTYWRDAHEARGDLPPRYAGDEGFLAMHRELGVMPYYIYALEARGGTGSSETGVSVHAAGVTGRPYNGVFRLRYDGVTVQTDVAGDVVDTRYSVGGRTLLQRKRWLPQSWCYGIVRYPVESPRDLETLREIVERCRYSDASEDYRYLSTLWGEEGLPVAPLPRSPMSALIVDWMGLEAFSFARADEPEEMEKTMASIDRANDSAFDILLRSEAEVLHFCDNLSASHCASCFEEYAAPYYRRRVRQIHEAGKRAAVHVDGTMRGLLPLVGSTGIDAAEALTPAPVGDIRLEDLRGQIRSDRIILWGGFPGVMFTPQFDRRELGSHIERFLKVHEAHFPVIAGSADQIPPDGELDRVREVSAALGTLD